MHTVEIKKDIHWVGAVDWNIRDFHGYSTEKGTTYNSYLALDEKITLFDTVKEEFKGDLMRNISSLVEPSKIDYIVVNHVEMDHSGSLPCIIDTIKPEKIFCSPQGKKALLEHFHRPDWPYQEVKTGDSISIGKRTISFLETRMLHWPDSMFSYIPEEKLLISSDAFGQHWATSERFDDQVNSAELIKHAAKYYANILLLFSPLVRKLLESVKEMKLDIDMIAPDHGLIWRTNPGGIVGVYDSWSRQEAVPKALIIYDTMWHSTEKMAYAIADGLLKHRISVKMMDLRVNHRSDIMTEVLDSKALIFGSPTINNGVMPRVADFLTYLKGLKPAGKFGAAFGSYGWTGEAVKHMSQALEDMKIQIVEPAIKVKYVPTENDINECIELGVKIGEEIKNGG